MIKFLDLQKINAAHQDEIQQKLKKVLEEGWFILGNEVREFEQNFAAYSGSKHCIGVGNGLDALVLIFKAYIQMGNLQEGDEIIVPANTYIATILALLEVGLVPVLVEPDITTYNLDPNLIEEKITPKTKGILPVHLYGQLADMEAIMELGYKHDLLIVEDAAQAHGMQFKGSHTRAFSFYPGKNLGALGDAGAITTNDEKLAKVLFSLRNYGSEKKYHNDRIGVNSRLDELQAAFLSVKLKYLDKENAVRKTIADRYSSEIKNEKIILPQTNGWHVYHIYVIRTKDRTGLQDYLHQHNIETLIHYPIPPHKQKALSDWNKLSFPITEKIHDEILSIPMSPVMTHDEVSSVIEILNSY